MAKNYYQEEAEVNKVGKDQPVYKASNPSKVQLVFKYNRSFELNVGRETFSFAPHEEKEFPAELLNHPDFIQMKSYFAVKGE